MKTTRTLVQLGQARQQTLADQPTGEFETIPVSLVKNTGWAA